MKSNLDNSIDVDTDQSNNHNVNLAESVNNFDLENAVTALQSGTISEPPVKSRKLNENKKQPSKGDHLTY